MLEYVVYPYEYDILFAMDNAYCDEMNQELHDYQVREREKAESKA